MQKKESVNTSILIILQKVGSNYLPSEPKKVKLLVSKIIKMFLILSLQNT